MRWCDTGHTKKYEALFLGGGKWVVSHLYQPFVGGHLSTGPSGGTSLTPLQMR